MYRRDLLTAEIQKLAQALARIMGLQLEGKLEEADNELEHTLEEEFGIFLPDLLASSLEDFLAFLAKKDFSPEKLDLFSQLLYLKFEPAEAADKNKSLAEKLQAIYQILEVKHHVINMINLGRQKSVKQHLRLY
ncbi:hypothetical protein [Pedobacter sp. L105]|uniref:hypothetical protein n=1 Tax=Pedobacter sp. L105 TaxID=1641871 RepID=UPI00131D49AD|nr:hypothetical protein [Pedobacter sp. L105]